MFKSVYRFIVIFVLLALGTVACGGSDEEVPNISDADLVGTEAAAIAERSTSQTATAVALLPTALPEEPIATVTLIVPTSESSGDEEGSGTLTPLPTGDISPTAPAAFFTATPPPAGTKPCYRANFEYETIPDGTRIPKNKLFVKTWRLKNIGSCTWTSAFSVIFVAGDLMGAKASVQLTTVDIPPGGYAEISIDMIAPSQAGPYKGNWMLLSPDGTIFGLGASGTEWFWIDIIVFVPQ